MTGQGIDQSQLTFHPQFLYRHRHWRTRVILESDEGTHFHVPLRLLTTYSAVFAAAATVPAPEFTTLSPVTLTFAPTAALLYVLTLLRDWDRGDHSKVVDTIATPKVILAAARIAHVLDAPIVGKVMTASQDLDVYMQYAIEHMVESLEEGERPAKPAHRTPGGIDLSFSLYPHGQCRRACELLRETSPDALDRLAKFHARRKTALAVLQQWWTTGEPLGRILRSDHSPAIEHKRNCKPKHNSEDQLRRDLGGLATKALTGLATATTTGEIEGSDSGGSKQSGRVSRMSRSSRGSLHAGIEGV